MFPQLFFLRVVFTTFLLSFTASTLVQRSSFHAQVHQEAWDENLDAAQLKRKASYLQQTSLSNTASERPNPAGTKKTAVLEVDRLDILGVPFYFTYIAFGEPPQPFVMLIDMQYGGAVVRSADCGEDCGHGMFAYNHSTSSTSYDLDKNFGVWLLGFTATGKLFNDDMHIVSLGLQNATLGAIDVFYGDDILLYILANICDGALGLAPPNRTSTSYLGYSGYGTPSYPNFLYELTASGALDRNIMTLSLPRSRGAKGNLTLGVDPPLVKYRIPLSRKPAER